MRSPESQVKWGLRERKSPKNKLANTGLIEKNREKAKNLLVLALYSRLFTM